MAQLDYSYTHKAFILMFVVARSAATMYHQALQTLSGPLTTGEKCCSVCNSH